MSTDRARDRSSNGRAATITVALNDGLDIAMIGVVIVQTEAVGAGDFVSSHRFAGSVRTSAHTKGRDEIGW